MRLPDKKNKKTLASGRSNWQTYSSERNKMKTDKLDWILGTHHRMNANNAKGKGNRAKRRMGQPVIERPIVNLWVLKFY